MSQPSNRDWMHRRELALAQGVGRPQDPRFGPVFQRGLGSKLWDVEGREYLDLTCGYSAGNFGHAFAPVLESARASLERIGHLTGDPHPDQIELAEQLIALCRFTTAAPPRTTEVPGPGVGVGARAGTLAFGAVKPHGKVIFNATGSRAIETAWKAAVAYRPGKLLVLAPGFHGRSLATSAISATARVGPAPEPGSFHCEPAERYPYCSRCPQSLTFPSCQLACGSHLFELLERQGESISAVLVEPALGARGYIFPPPEFFARLRSLTEAHGVLMIADEIQTGLGRCGDWLLSHRQGWKADLIVLGKSLGGGITPISAVVGRAEVLDAIPAGVESETFAATPLACAVALRVISELRHGAWFARADLLGQQLRDCFRYHPQRSLWGIQQVEGVGAVCALEFARGPLAVAQFSQEQPAENRLEAEERTNRVGNEPIDQPQQAARALAAAMFRSGRLVHWTGPAATRVVLLPPLTLSDEELQQLLAKPL